MNTLPFLDHDGLNRHLPWLAAIFLLALLIAYLIFSPGQSIEVPSSSNMLPVATEFQAFYQENGGLRVFGFPLSEAYKDAESERLIQYFQRMRLEYDRGQDKVVVSPLGQWALPQRGGQAQVFQAGIQPVEPSPTGNLRVRDAFLTFYQDYGGESLFGQPISDQLNEGGTRSQYFENARLDWLPEAPLGYRVQPGRLGEAHYRHVGIFDDPGRSRPMDSTGVREANVNASLQAPILYAGEEQAVYVDVSSPEGQRPISGVSVDLTVYYNGKTESFSLPETDGTGHTRGLLALADLQPGQKVRLEVEASAPGGFIIGTTSNSFKSWW